MAGAYCPRCGVQELPLRLGLLTTASAAAGDGWTLHTVGVFTVLGAFCGAVVGPLTDDLAEVLQRANESQADEAEKAGRAYRRSGHVVVDQLGGPLHPETLSSRWHRLLQEAGVKRIRLHDARHTCGTLLHLQGVPVAVISAWLGHADPSFTLRTYVHSQDAALRDAAVALTRPRDIPVTDPGREEEL
jgi:integrase